MFGVNPKWTRNLQLWGDARAVTVGNNSKTGDKGTMMIFAEHRECKSDSVRTWDPQTMRAVVMQDVIQLKHMHYHPNNVTCVLKLDDA